MSRLSLAYSVQVESVQCAACGVIFGIPESMETNLRRNHKTFYCPNGHTQHFPGESDVERATRELREEKARHLNTLSRANQAEAAEQKLTRKLKRVARGVCPECKRTFQNLARHMCSKHGVGDHGKIGKVKLP